MKVLMFEVDKQPKETELNGDSLKALQDAVGGYIECVTLPNDVILICNEEGKINSLPCNRYLTNEEGKMLDIICGNFFCCRSNEEGDLISINEGDAKAIEVYIRDIG